jgi:hypothetical protein
LRLVISGLAIASCILCNNLWPSHQLKKISWAVYSYKSSKTVKTILVLSEKCTLFKKNLDCLKSFYLSFETFSRGFYNFVLSI